jgi:MFS family permease
MSAPGRPTDSAWGPLRYPVFRALWIANTASFVGTWIHAIGASWLMATLVTSPALIALVQAAEMLPAALLALPSGALADIVDRRRLMLFAQSWMALSALALGLLSVTGRITPAGLLGLTFLLGLGNALNGPAWQSTTPELVPPGELSAAIALGGVGMNLARAVGPAAGGFIVAAAGPGVAFLLNAASFLGIILVLHRWRWATREVPALPAERLIGAIRAGLRYVRHSPPLHAVFVRAALFIFCGSALWALLPVLAKHELQRGPAAYGFLLAFLGAGAVSGAWTLPELRRRLSLDGLVAAATLLTAGVFVALAHVRIFWLLCAVLFLAGVAWIAVLSSVNIAAQTSAPAWVRARALAVYLLVFYLGLSGGSAAWGAAASRFGLAGAFDLAAAGLAAGLLARWRFRLASGDGLNLAPSRHWPAPSVVQEPEPDRGPVLVTVEYRIDPARARDFVKTMQTLRRLRRRDGAYHWGLYADVADPARYVETFLVDSWLEHLRQHERPTLEDQEFERQIDAFHVGEAPPRVDHLIAEG